MFQALLFQRIEYGIQHFKKHGVVGISCDKTEYFVNNEYLLISPNNLLEPDPQTILLRILSTPASSKCYNKTLFSQVHLAKEDLLDLFVLDVFFDT